MGVGGRKPNLDTANVESQVLVRTGDPDLPVTPPEEISEAGAAIWNVLLPDLIGMGVFTMSDAFLLFELCETLASAQEFRREAGQLQRRLTAADEADDVVLAEHLSGRLKRARAGYLQSMKLVMSIAGEFGVSPVARLRLGLMKLTGNSLLAALGGEDD